MILRFVDWQDLLTLTLGVFLGALASRACARRTQATQRQVEGDRTSGRAEAASSPAAAPGAELSPCSPNEERKWSSRAPETTACFNFSAFRSLFKGGGSSGSGSSSSSSNRHRHLRRSRTAPAVTTSSRTSLRSIPTTRGPERESEKDLQKQYIEALRGWTQKARQFGRRARGTPALARLVHQASHRELRGVVDAAWLNDFAGYLWPKVAEHVRGVLYDIVEPAINTKLPSFLQGKVHFQDITLGKNAPKFSDVTVLENLATDRVEIRTEVCLNSDLQATVVAMGARVNVANLVLDGELSVVFGPLMSKPPYFGGLEIFFVNPVNLCLELGGNIIPKGLHPALCSAIAGALARFMVLPNRIAVDLNPDDDTDRTDIKYQDPVGVLQLTVLRAQGLTACDMSLFGSRSSDPYVVATLGATRCVSPTISQSLNPVWGEDGKGFTMDLPFHSASQFVTFEVWDADVASSDDLIGTKSRVDLSALTDPNNVPWREVPLQLLDPSGEPTAGTLFVCGRLLSLTETPRDMPSQPLGGPSGAYLAVKVMEVRGLPSAEAYPYKVRVSVANVVATTKGSFVSNQRFSYALERVCIEQLQRGQPPAMVAHALGLSLDDVEEIGLKLGGPQTNHDGVKAAVKMALGVRAATNPHFEETVQLLIPDPSVKENSSHVRLDLLDKKGSVIGTADVAFAEMLRVGQELTLMGRIPLTPLSNVELLGRLRLRYLDL